MCCLTGLDLDYYADDPSLEQQVTYHSDAATHDAAAPAAAAVAGYQGTDHLDPDSMDAADLASLSKQIQEEGERAFTIMDMDVGLYHYEEGDVAAAAKPKHRADKAVEASPGSAQVDL